MTDTLSRKLKVVTFTIAGIEYQCQLQTWKVVNNTPDGERLYVFCGPGPEGEIREEAEPDYALELKFLSDWRPDGISDYLTEHDQELAAFVLDHHPDIVGEHVRWAGDVTLKAPTAGGDARTTELTEITLQVDGKPTYSRP